MSSGTLMTALEWIAERVRQRRQIAPETTFFFAEIKADWKLWWRYASREQKGEIGACGERLEDQRAFVTEIESWANKQWPKHPQVSDALIFQLLSVEPLSAWSDLRKEFSGRDSLAAYGVAIPGKDTGCRDHIWQLTTWLVPKLEGEPENVLAIPLNFETQDPAARNAPSDVIKAIQSTMKALSGGCFGKWYLRDGWKQSRFEKRLMLIASSVSLAVLALLTIVPDGFLTDDLIVIAGLQVMIVSAGVMTTALAVSIFRQHRSVVKDSQKWLQLLGHSRVLMAISADRQSPIRGASFSVTMAASLILALNQSRPATSALIRQTISQLRERCREWLFTGCLRSDGTIGPVNYLAEKLRAAVDFNQEAALTLKVFAQPKEEAREEFEQTARDSASSTPVKHDCVHAGSSSEAFKVRTYGRLLDLLVEAGARTRYAPGSFIFIAAVSFAGLALWISLVDLPRLFHQPSIPKASMTLPLVGDRSRVLLTLYSPEADQFAVRIRSDYWQSCTLGRFPKSVELDHSSTVRFELIKSPSARPGSFAGQGTVELIRPRSVLWRTLPPLEKLSIATFDDLISSEPFFEE